MLNAKQATEAAMAMHYPTSKEFNYNKEKHLTALREYRVAQEDVTKQFCAYLEYTYACGHSAKTCQIIWDTAWKKGQASGYRKVEAYYKEYSDLSYEGLDKLDY